MSIMSKRVRQIFYSVPLDPVSVQVCQAVKTSSNYLLMVFIPRSHPRLHQNSGLLLVDFSDKGLWLAETLPLRIQFVTECCKRIHINIAEHKSTQSILLRSSNQRPVTQVTWSVLTNERPLYKCYFHLSVIWIGCVSVSAGCWTKLACLLSSLSRLLDCKERNQGSHWLFMVFFQKKFKLTHSTSSFI